MAYLKDFYPFDIDDSIQNMYFLKWSMRTVILHFLVGELSRITRLQTTLPRDAQKRMHN